MLKKHNAPRKDPSVERWLKKTKKKQQFWQVKSFLRDLKLKFTEREKENPEQYNIIIPLFGLVFRFDTADVFLDDGNLKVFVLDSRRLEKEPSYFCDDVFWYLIEHGYLMYVRDVEGNPSGLYNRIIVDLDWGQKILQRRLDLYGNDPKWRFKKIRTEEFLKYPTHFLISRFPGVFDGLY